LTVLSAIPTTARRLGHSCDNMALIVIAIRAVTDHFPPGQKQEVFSASKRVISLNGPPLISPLAFKRAFFRSPLRRTRLNDRVMSNRRRAANFLFEVNKGFAGENLDKLIPIARGFRVDNGRVGCFR
jgi:hypothetical protein